MQADVGASASCWTRDFAALAYLPVVRDATPKSAGLSDCTKYDLFIIYQFASTFFPSRRPLLVLCGRRCMLPWIMDRTTQISFRFLDRDDI